jgi:ABC-type sugar transport system substrate-binding protein
MSRRKPLAALAAVLAALAVAVPAASASAAIPAPAVSTAHFGFPFFGATNPICPALVGLLRGAALSGNTALVNAIASQLPYLCPSPAI